LPSFIGVEVDSAALFRNYVPGETVDLLVAPLDPHPH
jgi:hypothetical protein